MKPKQYKPSGTLEEQAGCWVLNQHSPEWTPANEQQLQTWLEQDESHQREYTRALKLWQRLDQFKEVSFPARQAAHRLRDKHLQRRHRIQAVKRRAATGLIAIIVAIGINEQLTTDSYRTEKGQRQVVALDDGSEITLNTDTELNVQISNQQRTVTLAHGEVFFTITHDASRPFNVIAANARIHDIGTHFNVYTRHDVTQVAVTEGEVKIIADPNITQNRWFDHLINSARHWLPFNDSESQPGMRVIAGQQLAYNTTGELGGLSDFDAGKVTAWRNGRLVFELASLQEVVAQISRYHPVEFHLADDKLKQIKVTANFDTNNLTLILNTLEATFPIKAEWMDDHRINIVSTKR